MPSQVVNFREKLGKFSDHWAPRVVAELNDYQFKLVKIHGEFTWHSHQHTDEAFVVLEGEMLLELRDRTIPLRAGELYVVEKGVEHRPIAVQECAIMLVEPHGVVNTGDAGGPMTAGNDVWV